MQKTHFTSMLSACAIASCALLIAQTLSSKSAQAAPVAESAQVSKKMHITKTSATCRIRRGLRVTVRGRFVITNSEDGIQDNKVEAYGYLDFNGQRVWTVRNRKTAASRGAYSSDIYTGERTFDVMDNDSATWKLRVAGYMNDYDKGSDDDAMWNPLRQTREYDITNAYKRAARTGGMEIYTWRGDHDSESADLIIQFTKIEPIY